MTTKKRVVEKAAEVEESTTDDEGDEVRESEIALSVIEREMGRVRPADVDTHLRIRDADARLQRLDTLVAAWTEQQNEERALRKTYAKALIAILGIEVLAIFAAFFFVGLGWLNVEKWMAQVFLVTAFAQSASLVVVVVKYLFPQRSSDLLKLIEITSTPKQLPRK